MQIAIDVHSHMLCQEWLELFKAHSAPRFTIKQVVGGKQVIHYDGVPFMTPEDRMFDYDARFKAMDEAGVGMAILSLTGPNAINRVSVSFPARLERRYRGNLTLTLFTLALSEFGGEARTAGIGQFFTLDEPW